MITIANRLRLSAVAGVLVFSLTTIPLGAASFDPPLPGARLSFRDGQLIAYVDGETKHQERPAWNSPSFDRNAGNSEVSWPHLVPIRQGVTEMPLPLPTGMIPSITGPTPEEERAFDIGEPLEEQSWLATPHSAGMFLGVIGGATPIDNQLDQGAGGLFGLRFGYDYDYRWGLEKRFGFAQMNVFDVHNHHQRQIINIELGDVDLLFYPWGDTRWRPYMMAGGGLAHFNYQSDVGRRIDRLLVGVPFGIGLKYFWNDGVSFRVEMLDNLMLGTHEVSTMNNVSLSVGAEFRYAGLHLH